jgi:anti-sigma regulatory factor (Ser/Thr protein kinase)
MHSPSNSLSASMIHSISEPSQVAEARRLSVAMARRLGFDATGLGKVALVVTEAATNLVKHTTDGGELLVRALQCGRVGGIEVLALDKGPGIANVGEALRDGYSTTGSPGTGLGAISRLSTSFDIHSVSGVGTAVLARLWSAPLPRDLSPRGPEIGAVNAPHPGEEACGDGWAVVQRAGRSLILVADGLGHGIVAAEAAVEAGKTFQDRTSLAPAQMVAAIHAALRGTRGAAVAVAEVDVAQQSVRFAGVGNIAGVILSVDERRRLVSRNGTAGHEVRKIQEFTYPWPAGESGRQPLLILHSDGLTSRWDLDRYPGLAQRRPSLIAGVIFRDFNRGRDDVTVVVATGKGNT